MIGNDGGIDVSYDQGDTWEYVNTVPVGQFYAVSADMRKPYFVCGGLQDNGSWCGPSATRSSQRHPQLRLVPRRRRRRLLHAERSVGLDDPLLGVAGRRHQPRRSARRPEQQHPSARPRTGRRGGGAASRPKTPDPAAQRGRAVRLRRAIRTATSCRRLRRERTTGSTGTRRSSSRLTTRGRSISAAIGCSVRTIAATRGWRRRPDEEHRPQRSADHGGGGNRADGVEARRRRVVTATSSRSANRRVVPGIIWVGTNDGNLQVSRDGGNTWSNVADKVPGVPKETHVSRVEAVALRRRDVLRRHSTRIAPTITSRTCSRRPTLARRGRRSRRTCPQGNVNVIREDPKNSNLLYLGTEYAFYVSLDGGQEWKRFMNGLPTVRIDDILVHPRDNDLIVGTHGRSIYIMDDITALQQMTDGGHASAEAVVFDIRPAVAWVTDIQKAMLAEGAKLFRGQNPAQGSAISYWLKSGAGG